MRRSLRNPEELSYAQWLWSHRTAYAGVTCTGGCAGARGRSGARGQLPGCRLHTAKRPYALTIDIRRLDKPFDHTDFDRQATLLLGLVGNLDKVSVTSSARLLLPDDRVVLPRARVRREGAGPDRARLDAYLDASQD